MTRHLAAIVLLLGISCQRAEPMAGGRPLSHWKKEARQVSLLTFWNSSKDERRREAFRRLTEIGEPAVPALIDLFRTGDLPVSGDAFNALANLGPRASSAVPELRELARNHASARQRQAVWILGTIGPAAEPAVADLTALLEHPDPHMREVAARALTQIDGSGHSALAREQASTEVRQRAPRDLAAVLTGGDAEARADAAWRLGHSRGSAPHDPLVIEALLRALNDREPKVRIYAGRALAYASGEPRQRGIRQLRRDVSTGESVLRVRAARVLWDVGRNVAEVRPAYEAGLTDSAKWTRVETISAILDMGDAATAFVPSIERLSSDDAPEVRDRVAKFLHAVRRRGGR